LDEFRTFDWSGIKERLYALTRSAAG